MAYELKKRNGYKGLTAAMKFAVCDIFTGREYKSVQDYKYDAESIMAMEYSIYLLQQMGKGIYFGGYKYSMCMQGTGGIVSPRLLEDVNGFRKFQLIGEAKDQIINGSNKEGREQITKLLIESKDIAGTSYGVIEYLGAMANAHYIDKNRLKGNALRILSHNTPFKDEVSNYRALQSVKRLMR